MEGQFVGPMPVVDFLRDFVPEAPTPCPESGNAFQRLQSDGSTEAEKSKNFEDAFIAAVKESGVCPDLELFNTCRRAGHDFVYDQKPDISVCRKSPAQSTKSSTTTLAADSPASQHGGQRSISPSDSATIAGSECADSPAGINASRKSTPVDWFNMELFIECKTHSEDPFADPDPDLFEKSSVASKRARGQCIAYASAHMSVQFRCFCFSVCLIAQTDARLFRWDRSGVIVTKRFDFTQPGSPLAEFLWRFNHLDYAQRGHDLSVTAASDEETALAQENGMEGKIHKVLVTNDTDGKNHYFLISTPTEYKIMVTGRASFGDVALDLKTRKKVWLKDSWRIDIEEMEVEYKIYEKLHKHGVRNIAELVCGGDVGEQKTLANKYAVAPWCRGNVDLLPHRHYRLVLGTIGIPLQKFKCTRDVVQAVHDAFIAHWDAYERAKILHRDISGGNILMVQRGHRIQGILIDWDLSKETTAPPTARSKWRTGTWRFMSADILENPGKLHEYSDDLESFCHVIVYHIMRYRPWAVKSFKEPMYHIYEATEVSHTTGELIGGSGKKAFFSGAVYFEPKELRSVMPSHLAGIINDLRQPFKNFYLSEPEQQLSVLPPIQSGVLYLSIMDKYLAAKGWAADDGSVDQLKMKPATSGTKRGADSMSMTTGNIRPRKLLRMAAPSN